MSDNINYYNDDPYENKYLRHTQVVNLQRSIFEENNKLQTESVTNPNEVISYAYSLAKLNFELDPNALFSTEITDSLSGTIKSKFVEGTFSLEKIKELACGLEKMFDIPTVEDYALFYFIFINEVHMFPDSNGRISRLVVGQILELDDKALQNLMSKNFEIRTWFKNLQEDVTYNTPLERLQILFNRSKEIKHKNEFLRIIKGELPDWIKDFPKFKR